MGQHDARHIKDRARRHPSTTSARNTPKRYLASFAWHFNRRYQLASRTERLIWAAGRTRTNPHAYHVIIAG
jgi:hypothetical protein